MTTTRKHSVGALLPRASPCRMQPAGRSATTSPAASTGLGCRRDGADPRRAHGQRSTASDGERPGRVPRPRRCHRTRTPVARATRRRSATSACSAPAVARPQTTVGGDDAYPTIWSKAAALLQSIVDNHALIDGNKRLGWLATAVFLEINDASVAAATERRRPRPRHGGRGVGVDRRRGCAAARTTPGAAGLTPAPP